MSYLSVSTWSLHRMLGPLRWTIWNEEAGSHQVSLQEQPQLLSLLELPKEAAKRGYQAIEVCHFHFPSTEPSYLTQLREAFAAAEVSLDTLLLDYGDLTSTDERRKESDLALIRNWIDIASFCGARQIRIIAGEAAPTDEAALDRSAYSLADLASYASLKGVRVVTENFKALTSTGDSSLKLLARAGAKVGFITDFGNYNGESKLSEIIATAPLSVSLHVKPHYDEEGIPDRKQLLEYLEHVQKTQFDGAYVLIYDGPGDMWEGLERVKAIVEPYI